MAPRIAQFEKVSFEQFCENVKDIMPASQARIAYDNIKLPTRATFGSAGYDFYLPFDCQFGGFNNNIIPTGIRCKFVPGWVLVLCPKSGLGFKYGLRLANTVGVIDSDYYGSDNEGHILFRGVADSPFTLERGQKFMQGIFLPYGITLDDNADGVRNGGFGSTGA